MNERTSCPECEPFKGRVAIRMASERALEARMAWLQHLGPPGVAAFEPGWRPGRTEDTPLTEEERFEQTMIAEELLKRDAARIYSGKAKFSRWAPLVGIGHPESYRREAENGLSGVTVGPAESWAGEGASGWVVRAGVRPVNRNWQFRQSNRHGPFPTRREATAYADEHIRSPSFWHPR